MRSILRVITGVSVVIVVLSIVTTAYALTTSQTNSLIAFGSRGRTLPVSSSMGSATKAHLLGLYSGFYSNGGGGSGHGIYGDDFGYTHRR